MNAVRSCAAGFKTGALLARPNLQKYRHATLKIGLWPPSGASVPVERNSVRCEAAASIPVLREASRTSSSASSAMRSKPDKPSTRSYDQKALSKPQNTHIIGLWPFTPDHERFPWLPPDGDFLRDRG